MTAQEVFIGREVQPKYPKAQPVTAPSSKTDIHVEKAIAVTPAKPGASKASASVVTSAAPQQKPSLTVTTQKTAAETRPQQSVTTPSITIQSRPQSAAAAPTAAKPEIAKAIAVAAATPAALPTKKTEKQSPLEQTKAARSTITAASAASEQSAKSELKAARPAASPAAGPQIASVDSSSKREATAKTSAGPQPTKAGPVAVSARQAADAAAAPAQQISFRGDTAFIKLADGFDFPIGKPEAQGYYKARGFRSRGHLGEDWDGVGGGDTDLGDPIYSIGDGVVVFARDVHMGWGNVIIVRHSYREGGSVKSIDALYGHLSTMLVHKGQAVSRGQKIASMGNAHGLYDAHLHLEIRKNLEIGMSRAAFARDFSNYYDPSQFIASHRHLQTNGGTYRIALNTFTRDAKINFDKARNFSHSHSRGTGESAAALKKALAVQH